MARFFILQGAFYGQDDMKGEKEFGQLALELEKLGEVVPPTGPNQINTRKMLLKPNSHLKVRYFFDIMKVVQD